MKRAASGEAEREAPTALREKGNEKPHCAFYIPKKQRYCHLVPAGGKLFCTSHLALVDGERKLVCPYDAQQYSHRSRAQEVPRLTVAGLVLYSRATMRSM